MSPIQANNDPYLQQLKMSWWVWFSINMLVPTIGILFLQWDLFSIVYLFYWELLCWGAVGILKILSASGTRSFWEQISSRIMGLLYFVPLYLALLVLVVSFSFIEFETESIVNSVAAGIGASLIIISLNYLAVYVKDELLSGIWVVRKPIDVVFERFMYALPLAALVLFAVIPLAKKFDGVQAEKLIALGIILSKGLMDLLAAYLPVLLSKYVAENVEAQKSVEVETQASGELPPEQP